MLPLEKLPLQFKREGADDKPDGVYAVPHPRVDNYYFQIIFSSGLGWEHLSVTIHKLKDKFKHKFEKVERCPTWGEMCILKDMFWAPTECCVQYHPPMSDYVSMSPWCLHIWKPVSMALPAPEEVLVGLTDERWAKELEWFATEYPGKTKMDYLQALYYSTDLEFGSEDFKKRMKKFFPSL